MLLEVIAKDLKDIELINISKANIIEFCRELKIGSLTPTNEDIINAHNISKLPVNIIVRNTSRDFFILKMRKKKC